MVVLALMLIGSAEAGVASESVAAARTALVSGDTDRARMLLMQARAAMPKGLAKDRALDELNAAKAAWRTADCKSCAEFEFKSGDVLVFDGSPAADVAHGVLDTLAGTGPAELPDWAKGCAVSLQYRQRRK